MEQKYYITEDQFESIIHFKSMFEIHAETIEKLCQSGKDDIVYGFELGRIHHHLRECFIDMMKFEDSIRSQAFDSIPV